MADFRDRVERGQAIASSPGLIERVAKGIFSVQSQSGPGVYLVTLQGDRWKCMCPDFLAHDLACKHILAVRLHEKGFSLRAARTEETSRPRPSYAQDWSAYNRAQRAELRMFDEVLLELLREVEDPAKVKQTGRPRLPLSDVLFAAIEKVYHGIPLRVTHGLSDQVHEARKISCSPSRNMPSVALRRADVTPVLHDLVAKSALPLASIEDTFAVDSSGFRTTSFGSYYREKYGAATQNVWVKGHIVVGTATHIIPKVTVTDARAGDSPEFPGLINGTVAAGFLLREVYADKGYLSGANYEAARELGGTAYIMFKKDSHGHAKHPAVRSPLWKTMWHLLQSDPSKFLDHYNKRENVEAVFAAIKKKLGETISSRDPVAQVNELLCKVLAYNITVLIHESFEHGIPLPSSGSPKPKPDGPRAIENESLDPVDRGGWSSRFVPDLEDN
jgi:Transposase DDE domain/SWIM zinc finger